MMTILGGVSEVMDYEYALLVIRKVCFDLVTYPDGTTEEVARGDGAEVSAQWEEAQRAAFVRERSAARSDWETRYQAWRSQLIIATRKERPWSSGSWDVGEITDPQRGLKFQIDAEDPWNQSSLGQEDSTTTFHRRRYLDWIGDSFCWVDQPDRITPKKIPGIPGLRDEQTLPDGHLMFQIKDVISSLSSTSHDNDAYLEGSLRYIYDFFDHEPKIDEDGEAFKARYASLSAAERLQIAYSETRWEAMLFGGEGQEGIGLGTSKGWGAGFPEADLVVVLNRLSQSGRRVISVSEDNGVYPGRDSRSESKPVAIRYLLERDAR
jgi:hypothetical protein